MFSRGFILQLIMNDFFFYSICLDIIKNRLPLHHNNIKQQYMNNHTSINLSILHIIRLVVVASKV